jgi:hypothetical protein
MKRFFITFLFISTVSLMNGQINEIGVFLGGANFIGDVGATNYIKPNEFALGAIYKWNASPRHAWRISYNHATLTGDDSKSDQPARQTRDYDFKNSVDEFAAGLEFNFFDFNLHDLQSRTTPYVSTGLNYFRYNGLYKNSDNKIVTDQKRGSMAIPMIIGVKSRIATNFILALEVGVRYTFADDLDGSNSKNKNYQAYKFGNLNSNDWYTFSGVTLTYTFGDNPCYCPQ